MNKIHCLINNGHGLTDEIADLLVETAYIMMESNDKKKPIKLKRIGLKGEITTTYSLGLLGSVAGFTFRANFDWNNGSSKTDFIVKPLKDFHKLRRKMHWESVPGASEADFAKN